MMRTDPRDLDPDVVRFVDEYIDTIPELEAVLLIQETAPQTWDTASLARRLYVLQEEAEFILAKLRRASLVIGVESKGYQFNTSAPRADLVARLADTYRRQLSAVTRLVHDKPPAGVREFARAFDFRRKPK